MTNLFLEVINLFLTGSVIIVFVILLRLLMKKSPKIFLYVLWVIVFIRLICPFTIETEKSPVVKNIVSEEMVKMAVNTSENTNNYVFETENTGENFSYQEKEINNITVIDIAAAVWFLVTVIFILKGVISLIKLKKSLLNAKHIEKNIYEIENINTAFVFGIVPKIYIPDDISENEKEYIILHEKIHISRKDYIIKFLAYIILSIHWFNPFVWAAFKFMEEDMECSCDEAVIEKLGKDIKKDYSMSILRLCEKESSFSINPSFGEKAVKVRIKNILSYKKPAVLIIAVSVILAICGGCAIISSAPEKKSIEEQAVLYGSDLCKSYADTVDTEVLEYNGEAFKKADFENLYNGVEVWEIKYSFKADTSEELPSTDSWNQQEDIIYGEDKYLLFDSSKNELLCEIWAVDLTGSISNLEINTRKALEEMGYISGPTFYGEHVLAKFEISTGETCQMLISKPIVKGDSGIWCVERLADGNGNIYYEAPDEDMTINEYYTEIQKQCDEGHRVGLLDYKDVAYTFITDLGQEIKNVEFIENASFEDFQNMPESLFFGRITKAEKNENNVLRIYFNKSSYYSAEENSEELKNMGIDPDYLPNGYYIDDWDKWGTFFAVNENAVYSVLGEDQNGNIVSIEDNNWQDFENYCKNGFPWESNYFWITVKAGKITNITQQYIP